MKILPFLFEKLDSDYLATNHSGAFTFLKENELSSLINEKFNEIEHLQEELISKAFITNEKDEKLNLRLLTTALATRKADINNKLSLLMVVPTLRCDHSCSYCQVSRAPISSNKHDMSDDDVDLVISYINSKSSYNLKVEFQGGEPLVRFDIIKRIIEATEKKGIEYVITSNLSFCDNEVLEFCKDREVYFSTSLDGPKEIHNKNRGNQKNDSYEIAKNGIKNIQNVLGENKASAVGTITKFSLGKTKEIVDEYISNNLKTLFFRPVSSYGFAGHTNYNTITTNEYANFYKELLDYVLSKKDKRDLLEVNADIRLRKIFGKNPYYADLVSPTSHGTGVLLFNFDGKVYGSDEARMLKEMYKEDFSLGTFDDFINNIINKDLQQNLFGASIIEFNPGCCDCAYQPYCGSDPIYHLMNQGDFTGNKKDSEFCKKEKAHYSILFSELKNNPTVYESLKHR